MRTKIVAGNWKMNLTYAQALALADAVVHGTEDSAKVNIVLAPPFPYLRDVEVQTKLRTNIYIAAQNCADRKPGAFTGEVAASMLHSIGVEAVIVGHSERRAYYNETDEVIAEKVKQCIENNLQPVFCCGETLERRKEGKHFDIVEQQLRTGLFHLDAKQMAGSIIAYEPVWAIGTGINATPAQAQEMHAFIRGLVEEEYDAAVANDVRILYGGSVTAQNAGSLFSCADVDGALVGGASLKADEFIAIIKAMDSI